MTKHLGASLRELLPSSIADDPGVRTATEALDIVLRRSLASMPRLLLFARLAHDAGGADPARLLPPLARLTERAGGLPELTAPELEALAWQLHVENYECARDNDAARELILSSLLLHRRRGTPWAVRHGLETALRAEATIKEWFNYGGAPYFFRVGLDVTNIGMDTTRLSDVLHIIFAEKNVRSWLDRLCTYSRQPLALRHALALAGLTRGRVRPWMRPPAPAPLALRTATAVTGRSRFRLHPGPPPAGRHPVFLRSALGMAGRTRAQTAPQPRR